MKTLYKYISFLIILLLFGMMYSQTSNCDSLKQVSNKDALALKNNPYDDPFLDYQLRPILKLESKKVMGKYIKDHYPVLAKEDSVDGKVRLKYLVTKVGKVSNVEITKEEPIGYGFGKLAEEAIKLIEYEPVIKNGKAIIVKQAQWIKFKTSNKEE